MLSNNHTIRSMQTADLAAVFAIEQEQISPWTLTMFQDCLRARYHCYVLEIDGQITGFAILMAAAKQADILNIAVKLNRRRQGYGHLLLNYLLQVAIANSVNEIYLEVRESNVAARALYEKAGFIATGERKNYYAKGVERENAVIMYLRVTG